MLTFTHTVDALPCCPDMHSYTLRGFYIKDQGDCRDPRKYVAEFSTDLPRMLKTLEHYLKDVDVEVVYETILNKKPL